MTRRSVSEVLVVHRSPQQGGYWHVVAGGVEPRETVADAAARELCEETGLVAELAVGPEVIEYVDSLTKQPAERKAPHASTVAQVEVTCFRAEAADDWEPTLDWEHDDHRWCTPDEAFEMLRWPATARALRETLASERR